MEELQSSEVLDREILDDARREAEQILKSADETIQAGAKSWVTKTRSDLESLKEKYAERLDQRRNDIMVHLPLDKRRERLEKIDFLLHSAAAEYLGGLSKERIQALIWMELEKRTGELDFLNRRDPQGLPLQFLIQSRGFTGDELDSMLRKILDSNIQWKIAETSPNLPPGVFPALILDAKELRITVSAEDLMESLLQERRAELAAALLGEEALDA